MVTKNFRFNGIALAVLASTGYSTSTIAEQSTQTNTQATEIIQVKGIRSALSNSAAIKRDASGVMDAISAEDIGKFPDSNLAESLQRITGVSIDRSNNEGNKVSVRGFGPTFNLVTLNGRSMPTSSTLSTDVGINRSFNFQHIAAEVVSGVDVYKSGKAHSPTGGIGATINLRTAKPFDYKERQFSLGAKGIMDTSNVKGSDITPEYSALYSDTFMDDTFGVLVSYSHSERDSRKEAVVNDGWIKDDGSAYSAIDKSGIDLNNNPEGVFWVPRNFAVEYGDHQRKRDNLQVVLQATPIEDVEVVLDYTTSEFEEKIERVLTGFWFDSDQNTTGKVDKNGTVVNPRHNNHRLNYTVTNQLVETENDSIGFNVKWQATDALKLTFDMHDSTSETQPGGQISEFSSVISTPPDARYVDIGLDFTGADVPAVTTNTTQTLEADTAPGPIPDNYDPFSTDHIDGDVVVVRGHAIKNNIKQWDLGAQWVNQGNGAIEKVSFGLGQTDYQFDTTTRFGFDFLYDDLNMQELGITFTPANVGSNFSGSDKLFAKQFNANPSLINQKVLSGGFITEAPPRMDSVQEDTTAAYVSVDIADEINQIPLNINLGLRYESTDVTGSSSATLPTNLVYLSDEEIRQVYPDNATATIDTLTGDYTEFLPNFDISAELTDDFIARFSYSRTLTRSDVTAIVPATKITGTRPGGPFDASQGDPNLLPYSSNNIDLSFEWYYDEGSYASIGYFRKYVDNFIGITNEKRTINDANGNPLTDPSANPRAGCPDSSVEPYNADCLSKPSDPEIMFNVKVPKNLESAEVYGWELALQHLFGDSGFGGQFNFTKVDGSVEYDIYSFEQTVALTGLSDSANLVAFYDKDGIQVRFAYNWRDDFLLNTNQFHSPDEPVFTKAYGQLDMSASYEINQYLTLVFEGLNLTEETAHRHGRFENQFLAAEDFGSRYALGIRAKF
ncbi:TonB-dependent receptor [Catenovulum agarivorans DS-2]|uniref:TonB-dependent receptor n=1 Tax=Catenovulum agarivorans DS-2 TaxID=1328313 RepID=W7QL59_9ALTE|nr:TonB-dependent receptor [Catenovulum agarivorans]EWH09652.1 TonB-dependent receptor [Catenovulum agarivorans DS-2]